jgi:hypothetical protein
MEIAESDIIITGDVWKLDILGLVMLIEWIVREK